MTASTVQLLEHGRLKGKWLWELAVWTMAAALSAAQILVGLASRGQPASYLRLLLLQLPPWYLWAALSPWIAALGRRFPLDRARWPTSIAAHLLLSAGIGGCVLLLQSGYNAWFEGLPLWSPRMAQGVLHSVVFSLHKRVLIYWLVLAASLALSYFRKYRASRARYEGPLARSRALAVEFSDDGDGATAARKITSPKAFRQRLLIRSSGVRTYLPVEEIDWIGAADY